MSQLSLTKNRELSNEEVLESLVNLTFEDLPDKSVSFRRERTIIPTKTKKNASQDGKIQFHPDFNDPDYLEAIRLEAETNRIIAQERIDMMQMQRESRNAPINVELTYVDREPKFVYIPVTEIGNGKIHSIPVKFVRGGTLVWNNYLSPEMQDVIGWRGKIKIEEIWDSEKQKACLISWRDEFNLRYIDVVYVDYIVNKPEYEVISE